MSKTPSQPRHKMCKYCGTAAEMSETQCGNCGSALPIALPISLPQPVARIVEAQARWSMGKTGIVTSATSLILGAFYNYGVPSTGLTAMLILLWLIVVMPGMVGVSAIATAQRDAGRFIVNVLAAFGLWIAGLVLLVVGITLL